METRSGTPGSLPPLPLTLGRPQSLLEGLPAGISATLSCLAAAGPGPSAKSTARAWSSPDPPTNTEMEPSQRAQGRDVRRHWEP